MSRRYRVELTQDERCELVWMLSGGTHGSRKLKRAQILLAAALSEQPHASAERALTGKDETLLVASGARIYLDVLNGFSA